jgi:3-deoxy-D-manno-octulosonic-acid transferase
MIRLLYNCGLPFYLLLIRLLVPFNAKAREWIKGRHHWHARLPEAIGDKCDWIWFHCSSAGEYEDSHEIFREIKVRLPHYRFLLTFYSPSGYEPMKNSPDFDLVFYIPADTPKNARRFLALVNPKLVLFSRSDLWLNYLVEVRKKKIPFFLLSLDLERKSAFVKPHLRGLYRFSFSQFSHIYCQNENTRMLLLSRFGYKETTVTGNPRYDRVYRQSLERISFTAIEKFTEGHFTVIVGSMLQEDEDHFCEILSRLREKDIRCILVPHEVSRHETKSFLSRYPDAVAYSSIEKLKPDSSLLYVDTLGILKHLYKYANVAVIGGGFSSIGIHNAIEPAVHGCAITFGPNHRNSREALELLRLGAAKIHHSSEELLQFILSVMAKNQTDDRLLKEHVHRHTGASMRIINSLAEKCPSLFGEQVAVTINKFGQP